MSHILKFSTQTSLLEQLSWSRQERSFNGTKSAALTPNPWEIHFFSCPPSLNCQDSHQTQHLCFPSHFPLRRDPAPGTEAQAGIWAHGIINQAQVKPNHPNVTKQEQRSAALPSDSHFPCLIIPSNHSQPHKSLRFSSLQEAFLLFPMLFNHYYPTQHIPFITNRQENNTASELRFTATVYRLCIKNTKNHPLSPFTGKILLQSHPASQ